MRFFNTAGPVNPADHYTLPLLSRLDEEALRSLIDQKKYFILHAPRQTGKTSVLLALMAQLNQEGRYTCLYANIEAAQAWRGNAAEGIRTVVMQIAAAAGLYLDDQRLMDWGQTALTEQGSGGALMALLARWAAASDHPLVLLLDEVDALVGDTLISLLRQIRTGYPQRPNAFPQTVILCGVRDIRDYRIHTADQDVITGGSAFNIKAESLRLGDFSLEDVANLYRQHTAETGQSFAGGVVERVWDLTCGQPWLVNALAYETCFRMQAGRDRTQPITLEMIHQAKERLIQRRETHLDQLADKLREERVRRVIEPLLTGQDTALDLPLDDIDYVRDLGLVAIDRPLRIANPIYREVIPRQLTASTEEMTAQETAWYVTPEGTLDLVKLLAAFQQFFREHSEHWVERFQYREAGPQLLLQAFLQRIVNGGGRIDREYGLGRKRTDLLLQWPLNAGQGFLGPVQRVVIELKLLHRSLEATLREGLGQTAEYLERTGAQDGHLLIFDRRPSVTWDAKVFQREETHGPYRIRVWGL